MVDKIIEDADAALALGDVLREEGDYPAAEACYRQALLTAPDSRYLLVVLGVVLRKQDRLGDAIACFRRALVVEPDALDATLQLADALFEAEQFDQARMLYAAALPFFPGHPTLPASIFMCEMNACDWSGLLAEQDALSRLQDQMLPPHCAVTLSGSSPEQLFFASKNAQYRGVNRRDAQPAPAPGGNGKIRLGYLSSDFHAHATAFLIAELFEVHDREAFEVIGISSGPDDGSAVRGRLVAAFDEFIDISDVDDSMAALWISASRIDILIDLKGYTRNTRSAVLGFQPAPITVNYLGYPGTMGCDSVDYIIADRTVLPFSEQAYYSEKIVHLPDCYQVNDSRVAAAPGMSTRAQQGLPEHGFVFCCFNANPKITPSMFACWMRLLLKVEGSVLWLFRSNADAERHLRIAAAEHGVDPDRLVFAPLQPHASHLARYRLADLFLDTSPCNAHTTASDALRFSLPLLTLRGTTFAGRVAASLLEAVGAPELIADDPGRYEAIALSLAGDPEKLRAARDKITHGIVHGPLFDTRRFARHLEAAYRHMHRRALSGDPPESFSIAPAAR